MDQCEEMLKKVAEIERVTGLCLKLTYSPGIYTYHFECDRKIEAFKESRGGRSMEGFLDGILFAFDGLKSKVKK